MPVNATFGTIEYREGGVIAVPVSFAEAVVAPLKTVFAVSHVSGDALMGIEYYLLGKDTAFELIFEIPPDRSGTFRISAAGNVLKATGAWDTVTATAKDVLYSTVEPELADHRIVRTSERIDVILQYNVPCTITNPRDEFGDGAQFADFLDYAGTDLPPPNFYRKVNNTYPDLPLPDALPTADWTQDNLTTEDATIYLLRWGSINENVEFNVTLFNVTLKSGFVRGPVR